jgi:N-acetylglutamate synthase-like GNAT family acetyltransferase
VAFDGPDLFGSAGLVQHDLRDRTNLEPWLAGVYVTPLMRRQGIGTALVSAVENEARRSAVSRLYLYTATAEQYYGRRGWVVLERLHRRGEQQAVMILDLVLA